MEIFIYKLTETLFEGKAVSVTLPSLDGEITLLKGHAPIISSLKKGKISIKNNNSEQEFEIKGGTMHLQNNRMIILVK